MSDQPRTEAGRRLVEDEPYCVNTPHDMRARVLAIEAEASAEPGALREALEELLRVAFRGDDFLTQNGIPMTATPRVRRAVRKARVALAREEATSE